MIPVAFGARCVARNLLLTTAAVMALSLPVIAHAQETAQSAPEEAQGNDIIVTATKREATL